MYRDRMHTRLLLCSSLLHVEKWQWGSPHVVVSFSVSLSVPCFFQWQKNARYIHCLGRESCTAIQNHALGTPLYDGDSFMASIGSYASRSANSEGEESFVWDVNMHNLDYAWKYAVTRLREFCVERSSVARNACKQAFTVDTHVTPMPAWLGTVFASADNWSDHEYFSSTMSAAV